MTAEIVPFGKYKGQPVEVLIADRDYADWLSQQPWFRERYAPTYQLIVNYGTAPTETPEHNEMQAAFLDATWALAVAKAAWEDAAFDSHSKRAAAWLHRIAALPATWAPRARRVGAVIDRLQFEDRGWDVTYDVVSATSDIQVSPPDCACGAGSHREWEANCPRHLSNSWDAGYGDSAAAFTRRSLLEGHVVTLDGDRWRTLVECKPDLGDDFPAVLRQIKARDTSTYHSRSVLLVRRAQFERVTLDNVSAIFLAASIKLLIESDLADTEQVGSP